MDKYDPQQLLKAAVEAAVEASEATPDVFAFNCGFAWVTVRPATGPLVAYCKRMIVEVGRDCRAALCYGSSGHAGGWQFWHPGRSRSQSIDVHMAGARAFADVLRAAGLDAVASSRLD